MSSWCGWRCRSSHRSGRPSAPRRRATSCWCAPSWPAVRPGTASPAGPSASPATTPTTPPSTSRARPTSCAATSSRRSAPWPTSTRRPSRPPLARVKGHRMAKAALETAVLDAWLRAHGVPLARFLGATRDRVDCGVSVGIMDSVPQLLDAVGGYLDEGYVRIKLKIEPGWDVEPVRAVRERFGDDVLLQVDANTAYTLRDAPRLARAGRVRAAAHRAAARRGGRPRPRRARAAGADADLPRRVDHLGAGRGGRDPDSAPARSSTSSRAGSAATSRPGGCTTSASPSACRCGAAGCSRPASAGRRTWRSRRCPGFTLPGDTSASRRYYDGDVTPEFVLDGGTIAGARRPRHRRRPAAGGPGPAGNVAGVAPGGMTAARLVFALSLSGCDSTFGNASGSGQVVTA